MAACTLPHSPSDELAGSVESPLLSVVIPAYNEAWSLPIVIKDMVQECAVLGVSYEILVCNDGSQDNTLPVLRYLQSSFPCLHVLNNQRNLGVAASLQRLYKASRGEWVAFWPADHQIAASELTKMWQHRPIDIVIGRRQPRQDSRLRLLMSQGFNWLVRRIWGLRVYDVDSVVLYSRAALRGKFSSQDLCLPVEILYRATRRGLSYRETPISHLPRKQGKASGCNPCVAIRTLWHLLTARLSRAWNA